MGKLLSFVFAVTALGMLALVAVSRHGNLLDDAGLVIGFVFFTVTAWATALITAVRRVTWGERNWRTVVRLALLFWLPALPPLIYGLSGIRDLGARSRKRRVAAQRARVTRIIVDAEPVVVGPQRELVGARDRVGA